MDGYHFADYEPTIEDYINADRSVDVKENAVFPCHFKATRETVVEVADYFDKSIKAGRLEEILKAGKTLNKAASAFQKLDVYEALKFDESAPVWNTINVDNINNWMTTFIDDVYITRIRSSVSQRIYNKAHNMKSLKAKQNTLDRLDSWKKKVMGGEGSRDDAIVLLLDIAENKKRRPKAKKS